MTYQTKIILDKTTEIENYCHQVINQRKLCSKELSKYVAAFDYIGNILIALGATSGEVPTISFKSFVGTPVGIASARFYFNFFSNNRVSQKITKHKKKKRKKHNKIVILAKSKINSTETLISQSFIHMEISHGEFIAIFRPKKKYEKMKENVSNENEKQ